MTELADSLLAWYDTHARDLPWRTGPSARASGLRPDPYHVWLSEIMLQQTTVIVVRYYFEKFITIRPCVNDLAQASDEDVMSTWAGLGYYARAQPAEMRPADCREWRAIPQDEADLLTLPGIGPYTAAAITSIAPPMS